MAEVLIADLRANTKKFDADLKRATRLTDEATRNIGKSTRKVDDAFSDLGKATKPLPKQLHAVEKATSGVDKKFDRASSSGKRLTGVMRSLKAVGGAVAIATIAVGAGIVKLASAGFKSAESFQAIELQLTKSTGSIAAARKEMAFVSEEANRLAIGTLESAKSFAQLTNAAQGTAAEGEGVRQIYSAIAELATVNKLSNDEFSRVMAQVNQVMAKGKAELEDLKTIGEAGIPVFQLLGKSLGVSQEDLFKSISAGKIGVQEVLVLAQQIREEYSGLAEEAANTIPAKFRRGFDQIKVGFSEVFAGILESKELQQVVTNLTGAVSIEDIFPTRAEVTEYVDFLVQKITGYVVVISSIVEFAKKAIKESIEYIKDKFEEVSSVVSKTTSAGKKLTNTLTGGFLFPKAYEKTIEKVGELGEETDKTAEKTETFFSLMGSFLSGSASLDQLDQLDKRLRKTLGLEDKPLLDPEVVDKKTKDVSEKMSENFKEGNKKTVEAFQSASNEIDKATQKLLDAQKKRVEEAHQELVDLLAENESRLANEAAKVEEMVRDSVVFDKPILGKTLTKEEEQRIKDFESTFENLKENVQDILADTISDAFSGDLNNVQDIADSVKDIFANLSAQITSSLLVDPLLNKSFSTILGDQFKETGEIGGLVGDLKKKLGFDKLGDELGKDLSNSFEGAIIGTSIGAILGSTVFKENVEAQIGSTVGGLIGGIIGGYYGGPGGAALGAGIGSGAGGILGGLFSKPTKETIGLQTTKGHPTSARRGVVQPGPFGFISLFDEQSSLSKELTQSTTLVVAEFDFQIAQFLTKRQRLAVGEYLQAVSALPEPAVFGAEDPNDSIAQALQARIIYSLQRLVGTGAAKSVAGEFGTATQGSIETIQQRAQQAFQVIKAITDFKLGDMSQTALAIHKIREEFDKLRLRAETLGLPTGDILAEEQKRIKKVTTDFNQDIADRVLQITDPKAYDFASLKRRQAEELRAAKDASADIEEVKKLHLLELKELEDKYNKDLQEKAKETGEVINKELIMRMDQFARGSLSQVSQQIKGLQDTFKGLVAEAREAGLSIDEIKSSYLKQLGDIYRNAQSGFLQQLYAFTNPLQAAMLQINQQVVEFRKLAKEGIIPVTLVEQFNALAKLNARYTEANRIAGGSATPQIQFENTINGFITLGREVSNSRRQLDEITERFAYLRAALRSLGQDAAIPALEKSANAQIRRVIDETRRSITRSVYEFTNPLRAAIDEINQQVLEFRQLAKEGFIPRSLVDQFQQLAILSARFAEANRIASGASTPQKEFEQTIAEFIKLGGSISEPKQQIDEITKRFTALSAALRSLGQDPIIPVIEESANRQIAAIISATRRTLADEIDAFTDPFLVSIREIQDQVEEFRLLVKEGFLSKQQVDLFSALSLGSLRINQALDKISGSSSPIQNVANAFDSFIRAGSPLSQTSQRLFDLTRNFTGLLQAAELLGLSTTALEESYISQARAIREESLAAIEQQLGPRKQILEGIQEFLKNLRVGPELPYNLRLTEARRQFSAAISGSDFSDAVSAAETLKSIAREAYGSTAAYFSIRNNIEDALTAVAGREEAALEAERQRLIREEERQVQQIELGYNTLDQLIRLNHGTSETARGIELLLAAAEEQTEISERIQSLLQRTVDRIRA